MQDKVGSEVILLAFRRLFLAGSHLDRAVRYSFPNALHHFCQNRWNMAISFAMYMVGLVCILLSRILRPQICHSR
jgi:hypothetical protein